MPVIPVSTSLPRRVYLSLLSKPRRGDSLPPADLLRNVDRVSQAGFSFLWKGSGIKQEAQPAATHTQVYTHIHTWSHRLKQALTLIFTH